MEEFKNGVISEEALGEIAGGLKMSKSAVKKILAGACVGVLALTAAGGAAGGGYLLYNKFKKSHTVKRFRMNDDGSYTEDPKGDYILNGTDYVKYGG